MIQLLKNIFGGYVKQIKQLSEQLQQAETSLNECRDQYVVLENEMAKLKQELDKQSSIIPWFTIIAEGVDPVKGIETRMDWNEAFIQYLKDNGLKDGDELLAIQKWVAMLHEDTIEKIEQRIIENSDLIKENRYM